MLCILVSSNKLLLLQASYKTIVSEAVLGVVVTVHCTVPSTAEQSIRSAQNYTQVYESLMYHAIIFINPTYGFIPPDNSCSVAEYEVFSQGGHAQQPGEKRLSG